VDKFDDVGLFKGKYKGWMETYGGGKANPFDLKEGDIEIEAIAHSLSMICRYNGHCKKFFSVAEHCLRVADILPPELKLAGLLHDAAEAYLGDVIRPIKYTLVAIQEAEEKALTLIMKKFGVSYLPTVKKMVKEADNIIGSTEARDLMFNSKDWGNLPKPLIGKINPLSPGVAEMFFLIRFREYSDARRKGF